MSEIYVKLSIQIISEEGEEPAFEAVFCFPNQETFDQYEDTGFDVLFDYFSTLIPNHCELDCEPVEVICFFQKEEINEKIYIVPN